MSQYHFQCIICLEGFPDADALGVHVESHEIAKLFKCGFCDASFHDSSVLIAHVTAVHGSLPTLYKCSICKQTFQMLLILREHVSHCQKNACSITKKHISTPTKSLDKIVKEFHMNPLGDNDSNSLTCNENFIEICESFEDVGGTACDTPPRSSKRVKNRTQQNGSQLVQCSKTTENRATTSPLSVKTVQNQKLLNVLPNPFVIFGADLIFSRKDNNHEKHEIESCTSKQGLTFSQLHIKNTKRQDDMQAGDREKETPDKISVNLLNKTTACPKIASTARNLPKAVISSELMANKDCGQGPSTQNQPLDFRNKSKGLLSTSSNYVFGGSMSLLQACHSYKNNILKEKQSSSQEDKDKHQQSTELKSNSQSAIDHILNDELVNSESSWLCKICSTSHDSEKKLKGHISCHFSEDCITIQCVKCKTCADSEQLLDQHIFAQVCSGFTCQICGISFSLEASYLKHYVKAHKIGKELMKCGECGKQFSDRQAWIRHEGTHAKSQPYVCRICGEQFRGLQQIQRSHLPYAHNVVLKCSEKKKNKNNVSLQSPSDSPLSSKKNGNSEESLPSIMKEVIERNAPNALTLKRKSMSIDCLPLNLVKKTISADQSIEISKVTYLSHKSIHNGSLLQGHENIETSESTSFTSKLSGSSSLLEDCINYDNNLSIAKNSTQVEPSLDDVGDKHQGTKTLANSPATEDGKTLPQSLKIVEAHPSVKSFVSDSHLKVLRSSQKVFLDCDLCGGKVPDLAALTVHRTYHFMENKFSIQCIGCPDTFVSLSDLNSHMQQKGCSQYKCNLCNQLYSTQQSFVSHITQKHGQVFDSGQYECFACRQTFDAFSVFVDHALKNHVASHQFRCKICGAHFPSMSVLENHLSEIHKLLKNTQDQGKFQCAQCLSTFGSKEAIKVHRSFHMYRKKLKEDKDDISKPDNTFASYITSYFCQVCSAGFSGVSHFERHIEIHDLVSSEDKCPVCGEVFLSKSRLTRHIGKHSKDFLCSDCGKTFAQRRMLKTHRLVHHSGANPFHCQECNKYFSSKSCLQHHMRRHSGDLRFECALCGKKFISSNSLESHMTHYLNTGQRQTAVKKEETPHPHN
ncbi:Zinc finger protein 585b [Plakobranchus ocellatus]|uniref:Zinc finger protein 585b n=1 Tax=Plakobranchus ocellatus TaxID=259542 RepID=A0AAV3YTF2_9GAST|nr:Zinc finger protein 585b [Plakobranchus ocellatus]